MNLKKVRLENDLSQLEISKKLHVSRSTYAIWESEINTIPLKRLIEFCNMFSVSIDYVLELTDTKDYPNIKTKFNQKLCGERLKEIRKERKYTQDKLAKKLNTDNGVISRYEHGETLILTTFLKEYSATFNISCDYLVGRIDEKIKIKESMTV